MTAAAIPLDENARLKALHDLRVLDTSPEEEFDALVKAAALVCNAPICLISLVDAERQWFKANVGLPSAGETPRDLAFCAHAILQDEVFEVPDARLDARFADNPLVTSSPDIRFYAGAPLRLQGGQRVGTLCVIDRQPRALTAQQQEILEMLAVAAVRALEGRRAIAVERNLLAAESKLTALLRESEERIRRLYESTPAMLHSIDAQGSLLSVSDHWLATLGYTRDEVLGRCSSDFLTPESRIHSGKILPEFFATGRCDRVQYRMLAKSGAVVEVELSAVIDRAADGKVLRSMAVMEDVTLRNSALRTSREQEDALRKSRSLLDRTGRMAGIGGWEADLALNTIRWSDETCRIHGLEPGYQPTFDETIGFYAPEARPVILAAIAKALATGEGWDIELPFVKADGKAIWVRAMGSVESEGGVPARMVGTLQDVTLAVNHREAANESKNRIVLATNSGEIGIWEYNLVSGELIWDDWMYRLFGLQPGEQDSNYVLWARHLHPEDRAPAEQALQAAIAGTSPFDTEFRIVRGDGSVRHIRATAGVTRGEDGRAIRIVGANWDVSQLRKLTMQLSEQHELLRVTLQSIGDAVITTDADGKVSWLNPVAERMTGWDNADATGQPLAQVFRIVHEESRAAAKDPVASCLQHGKVVGLANHTVLLARGGDEYGIEDSAAPIRNANGDLIGAVLVFRDVTEQRRLSGEMKYRATHDALTGLVNRIEFESRLDKALLLAHESRSRHALMYIDLDQFKLVNDACGHSVGDQLLQQVSSLLAQTVRACDTLARLGGDEFAVILEYCSLEQAQRVAQQICDRMDDFRFVHDGRRFRIGTSIGLVPVDSRWVNTAAVLQAADTSCYAAKDAGRNRVHAWFDTDMAMRARHGEMQWTTRIEQALDENGFALFAQHIEPLRAQNKGLHAEVLLRMIEPDGTFIPPGAFLPAAERFNLVSRIDRWVMRHALAWLERLPEEHIIDTLSINLSGQSIGDRAFQRHAIETLTAAGSAVCKRLCFEITETAVVTNMADAIRFIEQVRNLGVRTALDDFGAGAASFGYLKTLHVDYLKIDGQFIKDILDDPLDDAAVRCFADVARVMKLSTVAEFVDRPDVLARLHEIGIDYAQGFLLHQPEPIDRLFYGCTEHRNACASVSP